MSAKIICNRSINNNLYLHHKTPTYHLIGSHKYRYLRFHSIILRGDNTNSVINAYISGSNQPDLTDQ